MGQTDMNATTCKTCKDWVACNKKRADAILEEEKKIDYEIEQSIESFNLKSAKFYKQQIGMSLDTYKKMAANMAKLGQYVYLSDEVKNVHHGTYKSTCGKNMITICEMKEGTRNIKHGKGIQVYDHGDYYQGEFKDGNRHGQGRYSFISGDYEIGNYANGKRNGYFTKVVGGVTTSKVYIDGELVKT